MKRKHSDEKKHSKKEKKQKSQPEILAPEISAVDYFQVFLDKVKNTEFREEVAIRIENEFISIKQKDLLAKAKEKLENDHIDDPDFPKDGICQALSVMSEVATLSIIPLIKTIFFTGLKLIICHKPPEDDFSDLISSFYDVAKYVQVTAMESNCDQEQMMALIKHPNDPPIYKNLSLFCLLYIHELKLLFERLTTEKTYWANSDHSFLLLGEKHATQGEYKYKDKIFSYFEPNSEDNDDLQAIVSVDEFVEAVKTALAPTPFNEQTDLLPIYLASFSNNKKRNNITTLLKNIIFGGMGQHAVHRVHNGMTAIMHATIVNDAEAIEYMKWLSVDPNVRHGEHQDTPFIRATLFNNYNAAKELAEFKKDKTKLTNTIEIDLDIQDADGCTALHYAVNHGAKYKRFVELIMANDGDPTIHDNEGFTPIEMAFDKKDFDTLRMLSPLFVACIEDDEKEVKRILESKTEKSKKRNKPDMMVYNSKSLLFVCLEHQVSLPILKLLVQHGANINFVHEESGRSIFSEAVKQKRSDFIAIISPLLAACLSGDLTEVIAQPQKINEPLDHFENKTLLFVCLEMGISADILKELLKLNADINYLEQKNGNTLLHVAAAHCEKEVVELIYNKYPDAIDYFNDARESVLYVAAEEGRAENIRFLCKQGAHIEDGLVDFDENTQTVEHIATPLVRAVLSEQLEAVKALVVYGANTNATYDDVKPIIKYAVSHNLVGIAETLIGAQEIDVNLLYQKNEEDLPYSLLSIAVRENHLDMAVMLLEHGAKINSPDEYDIIPRAPLYYAVRKNNIEMCKLLLQYHPDLTLKFETENSEEKTAIEIAEEYKHHKIVKLLKDHQAKIEEQKNREETDWLLNLRQLRKPEDKIKFILTDRAESQRRVIGLHVDPLKELKEKILSIIKDSNSDEQSYSLITKELQLAKENYGLSDNIKTQINWYLKHTASSVSSQALLSSNNNNTDTVEVFEPIINGF